MATARGRGGHGGPGGGLVDRALRRAQGLGLRRGFGDGSKTWLVVGGLAATVRLFRHLAGPGKPVVVTEDLGPGQTIVITHLAEGHRPQGR